jgi:hypothetical protein
VKTQNKVISTQPRSTRYQPRPSSGKLDQSTQNKIQPTDSNIAQAVTVGKAKQMGLIINKSKEPINTKELTPLERIGLGAVNQVTDYEGIVNWDHESKSILNQSIEKGFSGDWEGAGKLIQDNPYRFAGNLAIEVGSALIPATWGVKAVKYGAQIAKKPIKQIIKNVDDIQWQKTKIKNENTAKEILSELPTVDTKTRINLNYFSQTVSKPNHYGKMEQISKTEMQKQTDEILNMSPVELERNYWFTSIKTGAPSQPKQQMIIPIKKFITTENMGGTIRNIPIEEQIKRSQATEKFVKEGISNSNDFFPVGRILNKDQMFNVVKTIKKTRRTEDNILKPGERIKFIKTIYNSKGQISTSRVNTKRAKNLQFKKAQRQENIEFQAKFRDGDKIQGSTNFLGLAWGGSSKVWTTSGNVQLFNTPSNQVRYITDIIKTKIPNISLIKPGKILEGPYRANKPATRYMRKKYGTPYKDIDDMGTLPVQQTLGQKTLNVLYKAKLIDERQSIEGISLINVKNQPLRLTGPSENVNYIASVSSDKADTIVLNRANAGTTAESMLDTIGKHEPGHQVLDSMRGFGGKDTFLSVDASSGWDRITYASLPGQKHKMLSILNADKGKGVHVTKGVDALSSPYFKPSTSKTGSQVRRANSDEVFGMSSGIQNKQEHYYSMLDIDAKIKYGSKGQLLDSTSAWSRNKQTKWDLADEWKNRPVQENPWYDVINIATIAGAKSSQYDNQAKKNKYQKNKAKTQSLGGFGQFF